MCKQFSVVQFKNILPTDTDPVIGGGYYLTNSTIQNMVDGNPMFWWEAGINGYQTLTAYATTDVCDLILQVNRGGSPVTSIAEYVGGHPIHRPHGS